MASPEKSSKAPALTDKVNEVSIFKWFIIGILAVALTTFLINKYSSLGEEEKSSTYEVVATVTCTPDEKLWDKNGGWCMSEELPAGTYKISFESSTLKNPFWKDGEIVKYEPIPPQGIGLSYWEGKPFKRKFIQEASLGELPMVGAPIARIGYGEAFRPSEAFTLTKPSQVGISINKIPRRKFFEGITGKLVMQIERQTPKSE